MWLLGPADSQLLKVCLTKGSRSNGTSQSSVSVLNFLSRVGGGLEREERRERAGVQKEAVVNMFVHLSDAKQQRFSEHHNLLSFLSGFEIVRPFKNLHGTITKLPTTPKADWDAVGEQFARVHLRLRVTKVSPCAQIMVA